MNTPRTIDPTLPCTDSKSSSSNQGKAAFVTINGQPPDVFIFPSLPLPYSIIPDTIQSLSECALHQIQTLITTYHQSDKGSDKILSVEDEDALDDGFVICDLNVVQRKLDAWWKMFPRIKPFYALKCNPDIMVAAVLGSFTPDKVGFDCASIPEIQLALKSTNGNVRRCVYANPQRDEKALETALNLGVEALTFDGFEELHKVKNAYEKRLKEWADSNEMTKTENNRKNEERKEFNNEDSTDKEPPHPLPPEMILRLFVPDATSAVPLGEKFGAPQSLITPLAEEAVSLGLPIIGVSFHCGSGCHDPAAYETAIQLAYKALEEINNVLRSNNLPACSVLDIGGGYPGVDGAGANLGRFCGRRRGLVDWVYGGADAAVSDQAGREEEGEISAIDIANTVTPLIDELFPMHADDCDDSSSLTNVSIISEPGRYFVEEAFALCSRIYSVKEDLDDERTNGSNKRRMHYYIAQGVQGVFKDVLLCGDTFTPIPLKLTYVYNDDENIYEGELPTRDIATEAGGELFPSTVHGPSGEDFDIVSPDCMLPQLNEGDWLLFDRMGAYTLSIAARGGSLPIRYVMGGI